MASRPSCAFSSKSNQNNINTTPDVTLIIYNADIAGSLADAQWYADARGLQRNFIGFNFGTSGTASVVDISGSTITAQTTYRSGVQISDLNGLGMTTAIPKFDSNFGKVKSVLFSTYTPIFMLGSGDPTILPAYIGSTFTPKTPGLFNAFGRLGAPKQTGFSTFDWSIEQPISGGATTLLKNATTKALAAEALNNKSQQHWGSTTMQYPFTGYATSQADMQAQLAWLVVNGVTTVDANFNGGTSRLTPYVTGTSQGTPAGSKNLFAMSIAESGFNTDAANIAGSHPYSSDYTAVTGAWGFTWTSYAWAFGMDLLYNGGSAVRMTVAEPGPGGLPAPSDLIEGLILNKYPVGTPLILPPSFPFYSCTFGDPLYRPYKSS